MAALCLNDIFRARHNIAHLVRRTPMVPSPTLSEIAGTPVYLKVESQQTTGSFKLRGASNAVASLPAEQRGHGVVAASTGNHGRAVAYAARRQGMRAVICMSSLVPQNKVQAIRDLGAEVHIAGTSQDDAQEHAQKLVETEGLAMLPPFDHPDVIAGQGTLGLEILEQLPDVGSVLIPLSGGGLFSGIALALKSAGRDIVTVGVSMENGCAMYSSLQAGKPVLVEEVASLADSLGGGIGLDNRYTFDMVRRYADHTVLVSEASIARGMVHMYRHEREIVEGAAAVGAAALLDGLAQKLSLPGPIVLVLSSRNVDMAQHRQVIAEANFNP
jgi:threonine dehydratase